MRQNSMPGKGCEKVAKIASASHPFWSHFGAFFHQKSMKNDAKIDAEKVRQNMEKHPKHMLKLGAQSL